MQFSLYVSNLSLSHPQMKFCQDCAWPETYVRDDLAVVEILPVIRSVVN